MLAPGTVLVSRYRVLSQIGRGGMGAVFLVEHVHTGDRAALKILHDSAATDVESVERFKREARAPARIQSENVVRVLDADTAPELGGAPFLVMELLNGSDLQKIVAQRGPLPPAEVARVLGQAARALDKAHAMGIVHRDLKPENLFLHQREDGSSVVKILDFGISKSLDANATSAQWQLTRTGEVMGTPLYMSIEQALGRRELMGPGVDIWALGLIAIYLLTGEAYWQGKTVPDILSKVLAHAMYAPTSRWARLPPGIDRWLLRSCARMPEQRFATAGEQIAELAEILRAAEVAAVGQAATILPSSYPPMTPAHVTPPYVAPYAGVGASTNEPIMHTTPPAARVGMSAGAKALIALSVAFVALVAAAGVVLIVLELRTDAAVATPTFAPPATTTAPTPTATATTTDTGPIESLTPTATAAPPHPSVTVSHPSVTRAQCKQSCKMACVDATDEGECLVRCLKRCPAR